MALSAPGQIDGSRIDLDSASTEELRQWATNNGYLDSEQYNTRFTRDQLLDILPITGPNGETLTPYTGGAASAPFQGIINGGYSANGRTYLSPNQWEQMQAAGGKASINPLLAWAAPLALGAGAAAGFGAAGAGAGEGLTFGNAPGIGGSIANVGADLGASTGIDWAAIDAGQAALPWSEGLSNLTPQMLGDAGVGGANSLADFFTQYQQSGAGNLSSLFNQLDKAGGGENGLTGIGANTALQAGSSATSLLSRLMSGDASSADYAQALGAGLGPLLQYLGSNEQTKALQQQANQQWDAGSWARDLNKGSYQPGFSLYDQPGYGDAFQRSADTSARAWSAKAGNPAGSPTAQAGILSDVWSGSYLPALSNYRGGLLQAGGQGLNTSGILGAQAAQNAGSGYDAAAYGVGRLTTPQMGTDWLQQLMQGMSGAGGFGNTSGYKWNLNG